MSAGNAAAESTLVATVNVFTNQTGVVAATNSVGVGFTYCSGGTIHCLSETTTSVSRGDSLTNRASRPFNVSFMLAIGKELSVSNLEPE